MSSIIRDAPLGQFIRWATKDRYFRHEEEEAGFQLPWEKAYEAGVPTTQAEDLANVNGSTTPSRKPDEEGQSDSESPYNNVIAPTKTANGTILVDWYSTDDAANPQNWSTGKKIWVVFQLMMYTFVVYSSSAIYVTAQAELMQYFNLSYAEGSAVLSLYVAGYGLGPLLFSPLSEIPYFGRNMPYITSLGLFVILAIPTALIDNYPGLLILRFLTGFMGSPCLATGGATIQDMYSLIKLPYGLTAWVAAAFCAPAIGPVLSAYAIPTLGWRWPFWEILIMSAPIWLLMFISMPETSSENILLRRAERLRRLTGNNAYRSKSEITNRKKPFSTIVYDALLVPFIITLRDLSVAFTNIFTAIIYGTYYSFFEAFPLAYMGIYGFTVQELSLVYIGCFLSGGLLGIATYVAYQYLYLEPDMRRRGAREQEHRLVPATVSVWLLPLALFWFGWTARAETHWAVSAVGIVFFGFGAFILFQAIFMYLPLTYPRYAASLFAMNDALRSAMAAGSIIYAHPMYQNLGIGRGVSVLGGLMVGGCFGVVALYVFGKRLREKSRFAGGD